MAKFCKKCGSLLNEASGKCPNCDKMAKFCKKCGSLLDEASGKCPNCDKMAKFCKKCGSLIDEASGKCPHCDIVANSQNRANEQKTGSKNVPEQKKQLSKKEMKAEKKISKKQEKKDKKKQKRAQLTTKQKIKRFFVKFIAVILALIIAVSGCTCMLVYLDKVDIPIIQNIFDKLGISKPQKENDNLAHNIEELKEIDIGEEIRKESQVLETIDVATSLQVTSETDIAKQFRNKGFIDSVIYTAYSMDGTYTGNTIIDANSSECHPLYYASYISADNYCWTVYSCNGEWSASPISYMYSGLATSEIVVSEKNYIMSYDSYTNCFYKTIPSSNECIIKSVSVINSETLDALAEKEFSIS